VRIEHIGGLELLKEDLVSKRNLFTRAAVEYGLGTPRGYITVGQPGTGKSLTAKATGSVFNLPLLRLEAGKLFASHVGESEANWRTAFATAKAVAPCILWIDEAEGLFVGGKSSGSTDGGTTSRVIKAILQDMQFNGEGIFFMFTANDIDGIPDPLIDRCDVWSVDLPNLSEREAIWQIHIIKKKRNPKKFNIPELARLTDGYSGRQIEAAWEKAMTAAFNDEAREPEQSDITDALKRFVPTSVTMADAIEKRRKRLSGRAMPASRPEAPTPVTKGNGRKLAAAA
jgi:SpoVK/Ycf46/Vps4 family AAA+-type ATPase